MYEVVEFYDGGYCEEVVFVAESEKDARQYCNKNELYLGTDNYGEDGCFIRTPDGSELWD